jgi:hypothetical protein
MNRLAPWVGIAAIALLTLFVFFGSGDAATRLNLAIAYAVSMIVLLFALIILIEIATGEIPIGALLSESGGGASMSRFQLLIFTLVIALCLVLIVVSKKELPRIPTEILELLGVSASTYAVSKGIQAGGELKPKIDPGASEDARARNKKE